MSAEKEDIRLVFWRKWYNAIIPQKELDEISERLVDSIKVLPKKLAISSTSSILNAYFKDLFELKEKILLEVKK